MTEYARYLGFDQHKETIAIAMARAGREPEEYLGSIGNREEEIGRWLHQRGREWGGLDEILVCYEAGPCGYGLYRQLKRMRVACEVVAPSLTPRKPGERVRTDRRDAQKLARMLRGGELTPIWVPDEGHEALRDLTRGREAAKEDEVRQRHRLSMLLLRQGKYPPRGVKAWSATYWRWLTTLSWAQEVHQDLAAEIGQAIRSAEQRVARLEKQLAEAVKASPWAAIVAGLQCLRGVQLIVASTLIAETGDVARFMHPRGLMAYGGLVPSEDSSGETTHRGATGGGGNRHLRRVLIEAAWSCIHRPHVGEALAKRQRGQPEKLIELDWRAQTRLYKRYRYLMAHGKDQNEAVTAVARELCGFLWEALQLLDPLPAS